jgi:type I restriction enzyme, S subunit
VSVNLLLSQFDRLAGAPDAVEKLRQFVKDLAVRGQLVDQRSEEGTGIQLLERLCDSSRAQSRSMTASATPVPADAEPFQLPPTWVWCSVRQVGRVVGGGTPQASDSANFAQGGKGIAWVTPADLGKHDGIEISHGDRDLSPKGMSKCSATLMPKGAVLFSSRAPIGYVAIAANPISTNQGFKSVVPYIGEMSAYIALYFRAFRHVIDARASGTTFREVSGKTVAELAFPLPPLAEQHRIVNRVDELIALCDKLEAAQELRESRRHALRRISLQQLITSGLNKISTQEDIRFFLDRSEQLLTKAEHVAAVRRAILDLAVRGRLVPQNPADRPHHSSTLSTAEDMKKSSIHLPFSVPSTWGTMQVRQTLSAHRDISYGIIKLGPEPEDGGIPTLRCSDVKPRSLDLTAVRTVDPVVEREYARTRLRGGEVVINVRGTLGGVARVPHNLAGFNVAREVAVVPVADDFDADFLVNVIASSYFWDLIQESLRGIAYVGLNLRTLRELPVPVPPLAEQRRIVVKVHELMAVCDQLETALANVETKRGRLLEALLHDALNGAGEVAPGEASARAAV